MQKISSTSTGIIENIQKDTAKQQGTIDTQMQQVADTIQQSFLYAIQKFGAKRVTWVVGEISGVDYPCQYPRYGQRKGFGVL